MASTSSSGALLASSQSPFVMCTFPQMLFRESSVSCAVVHVAWLAGHNECKGDLGRNRKTSFCQSAQAPSAYPCVKVAGAENLRNSRRINASN